MLTKLVAFSAIQILTFQLWEFQHCKAMLKGKKHQVKASLSKVQNVDIGHFASNKENSNDCGEPVSPTASATAETTSAIVNLSKNLHSIDAKICWYLHMVNCHSSYNSCADSGAMFQVMFPDSNIASQCTLGKTKARYTMLYGIAPEFKKQLIYNIFASPFYTVSFDESLNSQVQMSQMDAGGGYWNNRKNIAETHYFDSKFMEQLNADVLLKNLDEKKTSWQLFFMDGVQLPQGQSYSEEAVYFLPLSSQQFLVLILSASEG